MEKIRLGRTDLWVTRTSFGALPIQRVSFDEAKALLVKAYEAGINFFDTARAYSDSEEKIGYALADVRDDIIIATKSLATTGEELSSDLSTSLKNLKTDYVDLLQLHNPAEVPDADDGSSAYAAALVAKKQGKVRHIGITNHRLAVAEEAVRSGLFDSLQFPLSVLSAQKDLDLVEQCRKSDLGVIAMKAMSGGLIKNTKAAFAFFRQFDHVAAIWGVQRESELDEWISYEADPPELDSELRAAIEDERRELGGDFCRGCGYCLPCPVDILINNAARMSLLMRRAPTENFLTPQWQERMMRIEECTECNACSDRCPYDLDTPALLKKNLEDYKTFIA